MQLEIQEYLRQNDLDQLHKDYGIKANRGAKHPNLVCLKYSMIDSPMGEKIVQQCRGIVLDEDNDWAVVSRPFDKFFNYGEGHAAKIDWSTASVKEKVDGSLMTIYFYDGEWRVQSSGTPDAAGGINGAIREWSLNGKIVDQLPSSFAEYFWQVAAQYEIHPNMKANKKFCYMFELTGRLNRIIVKHNDSSITLLGGRNILTGEEIMPGIAAQHLLRAQSYTGDIIPVVISYTFSSFEEIAATLSDINPIEQEGYVVVDANFNRVKIKAPQYVALHHAKGNEVTTKSLLNIVMKGESDEWVAHFEEHAHELYEIRLRFERKVIELLNDYIRITKAIGPNGSRKDFALMAKDTSCPAALFSMYSNKISCIKEFLREMHINKLLTLLGY